MVSDSADRWFPTTDMPTTRYMHLQFPLSRENEPGLEENNTLSWRLMFTRIIGEQLAELETVVYLPESCF